MLNLPLEIRLHIYSYNLINEKAMDLLYRDIFEPISHNVLICRQIYHETRAFYFANNEFFLHLLRYGSIHSFRGPRRARDAVIGRLSCVQHLQLGVTESKYRISLSSGVMMPAETFSSCLEDRLRQGRLHKLLRQAKSHRHCLPLKTMTLLHRVSVPDGLSLLGWIVELDREWRRAREAALPFLYPLRTYTENITIQTRVMTLCCNSYPRCECDFNGKVH